MSSAFLWWQAVVTLYCFVIFLAFAMLYPLDVVRRIRKGVLYDRPQDHETYIQGIEIEYMAGLSKVGSTSVLLIGHLNDILCATVTHSNAFVLNMLGRSGHTPTCGSSHPSTAGTPTTGSTTCTTSSL